MAGLSLRTGFVFFLLFTFHAALGFPAALGGEETVQKKERSERPPVVVTGAARRLHAECLVFDGHNDLPWSMKIKAGSSFDVADIATLQERFHTDIPRLNEGGMGAVFWSAYVPSEKGKVGVAARDVLEQIDLIHRMVRRYPETFELARTADDVVRIRKSGKIASLIGLEGGHAIENSLGLLRMYAQLGVRYMTLAHSETLDWVDSATDEARHGGLTSFGEEVVLAMNELGMLVDVSHVSADAMRAALRVSRAPVIASHSSAFAIAPHPRNVPDDVLEMFKENRGVVMVNFYSAYVVAESARARARMFEVERELEQKYPDRDEFKKAWDDWHETNPIVSGTVHDLIDHIDHIVRVAGIDCVGLGSDFDGVPMTPDQLDDVSCFPVITQALLDRGYTPRNIRKIMGENTLRVLREAEQVAGTEREK
ncbi:MAG: dipeptidase [Planctomycetia bacterium]|nr:dipeptidase [Planctomycetia bacterium]